VPFKKHRTEHRFEAVLMNSKIIVYEGLSLQNMLDYHGSNWFGKISLSDSSF
jgi:hypothetical protein